MKIPTTPAILIKMSTPVCINDLFIAPLRGMSHFKFERLLVELPAAVALEFPGGYETEMFVVTFGFTILRLHLLAEMAAAAFPAVQRVLAHQLAQLDEIGYPSGLVQLRV